LDWTTQDTIAGHAGLAKCLWAALADYAGFIVLLEKGRGWRVIQFSTFLGGIEPGDLACPLAFAAPEA
jgi:hypothetical protein